MHKVLIKQKLHLANRSSYADIISALLLGIPSGVSQTSKTSFFQQKGGKKRKDFFLKKSDFSGFFAC